MSDERKMNIQVRVSTRDALLKLGRKGDTYDDVIRKLLQIARDDDGS